MGRVDVIFPCLEMLQNKRVGYKSKNGRQIKRIGNSLLYEYVFESDLF